MSVKCTERVVQVAFIYAQKDSFAHRYGFFEICGCVPLDLGLFGPVARSRRALYLRRAAGGCFGGAGLLRRRWALAAASAVAGAGLRALVCWPAGDSVAGASGAGRCVCLFPRGRSFFSPLPRMEGWALTPGGLCGR